MRIIRKVLRQIAGSEVEAHYRRTVYRVFQILISIVALFLIFAAWGISLTGLIAGAGFMGIVIGLAAQETLGNIISGIIMMFSRPFEVGEWIEVSEFSGIVEDISIIYTEIETFDGEVISIPNQVLSSSAIDNMSREKKLRVKKSIGIDYEADTTKAKKIAEEELKEHELISSNPSPKAMFKELGDSSVNMDLLFWIENPTPKKRRKTIHDVITSIKKEFEKEDIGIPFPHTELIQHEDRGWKFEK